FFHPQIDHDDLLRSMEVFDIGLALERPDNPAYSLTLTNKVFSYLLAGLPVAATNTPGQMEVVSRIPGAAVSYSAGNPEDLARSLESWVLDPARLRRAQEEAWTLAREQYCWERQSQYFIEQLTRSPAQRAMKAELCGA